MINKWEDGVVRIRQIIINHELVQKYLEYKDNVVCKEPNVKLERKCFIEPWTVFPGIMEVASNL